MSARQPGQRPLSVEGHTDSVGSDEVNQKLSQERAETVRNTLESAGLATSRLGAVARAAAGGCGGGGTAKGAVRTRSCGTGGGATGVTF